ncbi:MAG: heparan-alpha-glucosaminide N-acetyltransferase domain-containing protein [Myxococcales bacterium]
MSDAALEPRADRTRSIDLLRGGVMVLMVLDHARDFFVGVGPGPTDLATTTVPLFLTRWVTHFCAPVFVLLAGVSAQLYAQKRGLPAARRFLLTRGLWLVLLELTIVRFAWIPDPFYHFVLLQVIWVLGWSMVVLAGLSYLPRSAVLVVGAVIVLGHNALDRFDRGNFGQLEPVWNLLHERAMLKFSGRRVFVSYPVLPWLGVAALGFGLGSWYQKPPPERQRLLLRCGALATLGFVLLRAVNIYGDPQPWSTQARGSAFTVLSFLNCQKYPPSLAYLLMTLGPALIVLALLERVPARSWQPIVTFGRVPLFFYVAHLYLLRFTAAPLAFARWGPSAFKPPPGHAGSPGLPLWTAYLALVLAILLLYPACRWFARKKAESRSPWLSYL